MPYSKWWQRLSVGLVAVWTATSVVRADDLPVATPTLQLVAPAVKDQDDLCIWVHPTTPAQSAFIASDKSAGRLFVYDVEGRLLQEIAAPKPGNIDLRQNVDFGGRRTDLVVVNQRTDGFKLLAYEVDRDSRQLKRVDDGQLVTGPNYGGCLYKSEKNGRLYFICTSEGGAVEQHELSSDAARGIRSTKVRSLSVGKCEGAVADDETGTLFIAEEKRGIWKFGAEPGDPVEGTLIARIGDRELVGDLEGLAIATGKDRKRYLIVSDQGANRFVAYQCEAPHARVAQFAIEGARQTDGIEVSTANLGPRFPEGVFACHTDVAPRGLLVTPWSAVATKLGE